MSWCEEMAAEIEWLWRLDDGPDVEQIVDWFDSDAPYIAEALRLLWDLDSYCRDVIPTYKHGDLAYRIGALGRWKPGEEQP